MNDYVHLWWVLLPWTVTGFVAGVILTILVFKDMGDDD